MGHAEFQLASGGVVGRDHRHAFRNYQDASLVMRTADFSLAMVADGCGSGLHSEVGAALGVRLIGEALTHEMTTSRSGSCDWSRLQQRVLAKLDVLADQLGGSYRQAVEDYFLFTVNGVLLTDELATFFALGDGILAVNGYVQELGPFPGNMPPYMGYGLMPERIDIDPAAVRLQPVFELPTDKVEHFLLGTDGVGDLIAAANRLLPGMQALCGDVSQFWENDRYFSGNPELVSRQLRLMARDWPKRDPEPGLLPDDTTLVVGRRVLSEGE